MLNLFGINEDHNKHEHPTSSTSQNASHAAQQLGLKLNDLRNIQLSFVVCDNALRSKEVTTTADIDVGSVAVKIVKRE